jgi:hypothetical protein
MARNLSKDKILPGVTPTEYCEAEGRKLSDFRYVGVHVNSLERTVDFSPPRLPNPEILARFLDAIPEKAVVVLGYTMITSATELGIITYASGTALVPKTKTPRAH